jgi:hypothetical protein
MTKINPEKYGEYFPSWKVPFGAKLLSLGIGDTTDLTLSEPLASMSALTAGAVAFETKLWTVRQQPRNEKTLNAAYVWEREH